MIPFSLDAIEVIGCEVFPLIFKFVSKLFPSGSQNILTHELLPFADSGVRRDPAQRESIWARHASLVVENVFRG